MLRIAEVEHETNNSPERHYEASYENPFEKNIDTGLKDYGEGLHYFFGKCKKMTTELDALCSIASIAGSPVPKELELTLKLFKVSLSALTKGEETDIVDAASGALVQAQLVGIPVPKDAPAYMKLAEIAREYVGPYMKGKPFKRTSTDMGLDAAGSLGTIAGLLPEKYGMKHLASTSGQLTRHIASMRSMQKNRMESRGKVNPVTKKSLNLRIRRSGKVKIGKSRRSMTRRSMTRRSMTRRSGKS